MKICLDKWETRLQAIWGIQEKVRVLDGFSSERN